MNQESRLFLDNESRHHQLQQAVELIAKNRNISPSILKANIESTRDATAEHPPKSGYYPACGGDAFRVFLAFNLKRFIYCDHTITVERSFANELQQLGIPYTTTTPEPQTRIFNFEFAGELRTVTELTMDARLVDEKKRGGKKVDLWYVYAPTGAGQDLRLSDESGQEKIFPGINHRLDKENYLQVAEGGFLVFEEQPLLHQRDWPATNKALLELLGLKEATISKRKPGQNEPEHNQGYIYEKITARSPETITSALIIANEVMQLTYDLSEVARANFTYLNTEQELFSDPFENLKATIDKKIQFFSDQAIKAAETEPDSQISAALLKLIKTSEQEFRAKISTIQQNFREFLNEYDHAMDEFEAGHIEESEVLKRLELEFDPDTEGMKSTLFPAAHWIINEDRAVAKKAMDQIKKFAHTDLSRV